MHLVSSSLRSPLQLIPVPKLQEAADRFQLGSSLRWNGWGYLDTEFKVNDQKQIELTGTRYASSGKVLPSFREWAETVIGLNIDDVSVEQKKMPVPAVVNKYDTVFSVLAYNFVLSIFVDNVWHGKRMWFYLFFAQK